MNPAPIPNKIMNNKMFIHYLINYKSNIRIQFKEERKVLRRTIVWAMGDKKPNWAVLAPTIRKGRLSSWKDKKHSHYPTSY